MPFFLHIAAFVHSLFKSRRQLTLENLALRQQLAMLKTIGEASAGIYCRPLVLAPFLKICRGMAINVARIAPRYCRALASTGLSVLLALEESKPQARPPAS